jgi:hypothetical protein
MNFGNLITEFSARQSISRVNLDKFQHSTEFLLNLNDLGLTLAFFWQNTKQNGIHFLKFAWHFPRIRTEVNTHVFATDQHPVIKMSK